MTDQSSVVLMPARQLLGWSVPSLATIFVDHLVSLVCSIVLVVGTHRLCVLCIHHRVFGACSLNSRDISSVVALEVGSSHLCGLTDLGVVHTPASACCPLLSVFRSHTVVSTLLVGTRVNRVWLVGLPLMAQVLPIDHVSVLRCVPFCSIKIFLARFKSR